MIRCASCLMLLVGASNATAEVLPLYRFVKQVDRTETGEQEILAATLDADVYAATRDGFPDLRIVGPAGDVPMRISKAARRTTRERREPCPSSVVSLDERDDNAIEIIVRLDERAPAASGLNVETPLRDYERRIQVFGSSDGQNWRPLVENAAVFDYSRYMDVSSRSVEWPSTDDRWFKVVVDNVSDEQRSSLVELTRQFRGDEEQKRVEQTTIHERPLRIDRIELWRGVPETIEREEVEFEYPVVKFAIEQDPEKKRTIVNVTTRREPLTALGLVTSTGNFSRRATVEALNKVRGREQWSEIGSGVISSIRFRGFAKDHLYVAFPEQRAEKYRLVIENEDNPVLAIDGITSKGHVYRAEFMAEPDADYRVYYGSDAAERPDYDTAAITAAMQAGFEPAVRTLGPQAPNGAYDATADAPRTGLLESRWFFLGVVALLVVFLAVVLFRAGRRIEASD